MPNNRSAMRKTTLEDESLQRHIASWSGRAVRHEVDMGKITNGKGL